MPPHSFEQKKSNLWLSDYNSWLYQDCKKELKLSLTLKLVNFAGFEYYCLFIFSSSTSTCIFCTIQNLHLFRIKQRSSKSSTELACMISNVRKWIKAILLSAKNYFLLTLCKEKFPNSWPSKRILFTLVHHDFIPLDIHCILRQVSSVLFLVECRHWMSVIGGTVYTSSLTSMFKEI